MFVRPTAKLLAAAGAAVLLVSTPVSASPGQPTQQSSPQRITVQVEGSGPDILLIPGLASSRQVWADLAARLRPNHRLHLVQLAGFAGEPGAPEKDGKVIAPAVEAVADYIRNQHLKAPVIIGHSLGGEMALMLGTRHPDQVGRLLVVDALPFYTLLVDPAATRESAMPHAAAMRASLLAASAQQSEAMQRAAIARLAKNEAARPALVQAGIDSERQTVADAVYELMVTDLRPELSHIKVPVEVVYAYDDFYGVPAANVDGLFRQAYASAPDIHFTRIDGSYHFVMLDQPEKFASAVEAFLAK